MSFLADPDAGEGDVLTQCVDFDECASDPCENDATCVNERDMFSCACVGGFTGETCETDIDECASSPCVNAVRYAIHCAAFVVSVHVL